MRVRVAAFVLVTCLAPLKALAAENCDKRLGSAAQSLKVVMQKALERGALSVSDLESFLNAGEWANPFLTSDTHVLTPKFRTAFQTLSDKMSHADRAQAKHLLTAMLEGHASRQHISTEAKQATRFVLAPKEIPGLENSFVSIIEGKWQGRPVFWGHRTRGQMLYDPHNPDPERRQLIFTRSKELNAALEGRTEFSYTSHPVFVTNQGRTYVVDKPNGRIYDLEAGIETLLPSDFVVPASTSARIEKIDSKTVAFFAEGGKELSRFKIPSQNHNVGDTGFAFFNHQGRTFAPVVYQDQNQIGGVCIVDVATGRLERDIPLQNLAEAQMVNKNGQPHLAISVFRQIWLYNLINGERSEIHIVDPFARPTGKFTLHGSDYLFWAVKGTLRFVDVETSTILNVPGRDKEHGSLNVYEYNGNIFSYFGRDFKIHYQLTMPAGE